MTFKVVRSIESKLIEGGIYINRAGKLSHVSGLAITAETAALYIQKLSNAMRKHINNQLRKDWRSVGRSGLSFKDWKELNAKGLLK